MINVSSEFNTVWQKRRDFEYKIEISFANSSVVKVLYNSQIAMSNGAIEMSTGSSSFPLGNAIAKTFTIQLANTHDEWSTYDFYGAVLDVSCHLPKTPETDTIHFGRFTVIEPENYGTTISIKTIDNMYKADVPYECKLQGNITAGQLMNDACYRCGLSYVGSMTNEDYIVRIPENKTCREVIGLCAMIGGGNALCDWLGQVYVKSYDIANNQVLAEMLDGGVFDHPDDAGAYETGDTVDGGDFTYSETDMHDGGDFTSFNLYHTLTYSTALTTEVDDVVITGFKATIDKQEYLYGVDGYVISVENDLFNDTSIVGLVGRNLVGLRFRPFDLDYLNYPLCEHGDNCYIVDRKGNYYLSIITDYTFKMRGNTKIECTADRPIRNSSTYNSASTKALIKAREDIAEELTDYDKQVMEMTNVISQGLGVFITANDGEGGAKNYILHNKPEVKDSNIQWKFTENGLMVSTDYGKTWNAGITAEGKATVNVLNAIGINADWINAGTINGITISGNTLKGNNIVGGSISGNSISGGSVSGTSISGGSININNRFTVDSSGNLHAENGSFSGTINANGVFGGNLNGAGGTANLSGSLSGSFSGTGALNGSTTVNGTNINTYVKNLIAETVTADYIQAKILSASALEVNTLRVHGNYFSPSLLSNNPKYVLGHN